MRLFLLIPFLFAGCFQRPTMPAADSNIPIAHPSSDTNMADQYERYIRNLSAGTLEKDIEVALSELALAGKAAFPALVSHLTDRNLAEPRYFQEEKLEKSQDGKWRIHPPLIGEACFGILQCQIEGNWPKGFRQYHVLTPSNVAKWLDAHRDLNLIQLRQLARQDSLKRAKRDLAKYPSSELNQRAVNFLQEKHVYFDENRAEGATAQRP